MTKVCVTDDAPSRLCVTSKPQVRSVNDADDAGDAVIPTSDRRGHALPTWSPYGNADRSRPPRHPPKRPPGPVSHPRRHCLRCSRYPLETVYQWRKKRTGPRGFRIGRHLRYDPADVRAYVDQRKQAEIAA